MTVPYQLHITSAQNPRIKNLVRLRNHRDRDAQGVFCTEEPLVIRRALANGYRLETLYFCLESLTDREGRELLAETAAAGGDGPEFVRLAGHVMQKVSYRDKPTGLLAVGAQRRLTLDDLVLPEQPLLVVVVGIEKPGNLGAILRAADGAGAHAVLLADGGTDLYNPNVLRTSRGALFAVPIVAGDSATIMDFLQRNGLLLIGTTPAASRLYTKVDLTGPVAVLLGAEDKGLAASWLERADRRVRIPMAGQGDSLNVAATAAIVLYEAVRQRV
jgi:TrmH family RNA methyltransferase